MVEPSLHPPHRRHLQSRQGRLQSLGCSAASPFLWESHQVTLPVHHQNKEIQCTFLIFGRIVSSCFGILYMDFFCASFHYEAQSENFQLLWLCFGGSFFVEKYFQPSGRDFVVQGNKVIGSFLLKVNLFNALWTLFISIPI